MISNSNRILKSIERHLSPGKCKLHVLFNILFIFFFSYFNHIPSMRIFFIDCY